MFEKVGQLVHRHFGIAIVIVVLPLLLVFALVLPDFWTLIQVTEEILCKKERSELALQKQKKKELFQARYASSVPDLVKIEHLPLLAEQKQSLVVLKNHPACMGRSALIQQLAQWEQNKVSLVQGSKRKKNYIEEVEWKLQKPIEVSPRDIERLLCLLEDVEIGQNTLGKEATQRLITQWTLCPKGKNFDLDFSFLQREFFLKE